MDIDESWFVGVDVGGTFIKAGVASGSGQIIAEFQIATEQHRGPAEAFDRLRAEMDSILNQQADKVVAAGLGTPGPLDSRSGYILDPVNLPGWRDFPVRDELRRHLNVPVTYTNDANAAAYGEYWQGRAKDCSSLVLLTLGTGVGAGIICEGYQIVGRNDQAAECGHCVVDFSEDARLCSCGKTGHLEAYASATAIAEIAKTAASANPSSKLATVLETAGDLNARDVYHCAEQQDPLALQIVDQTASYLARGIADICHTIDPEIILLGGAMNFGGPASESGKRFLNEIADRVKRSVFERIANHLRIEFATLGGSAGWIGAAGLAQRFYTQNS